MGDVNILFGKDPQGKDVLNSAYVSLKITTKQGKSKMTASLQAGEPACFYKHPDVEFIKNANTGDFALFLAKDARPIPEGRTLMAEKPLVVFSGQSNGKAGSTIGCDKYFILNGLDYIYSGQLKDMMPRTFENLYIPGSKDFDADVSAGEEELRMELFRKKLTMNAFKEDVHTCLYHRSSMINHSCDPNAMWSIDASKKMLISIKSTKIILPGDEITHSYLGEHIVTFPKKKRRQILADHYGFDCTCLSCKPSKGLVKKIDSLSVK